ncbi:MAG: FAD-binding oxidoreductase [Pseudomonadota bacterium]
MKRPTGKGRIWQKTDPGFDKAVLATSFNGRDPGRRPELFVEANSVEDVKYTLRQARERGLNLSVCSGGHSWNQNHLRDNSVLLSMARFNKVEIDAEDGVARVGPGTWSYDLDRAAQRQNLFFPVAHVNDVCMGGFLLQGGFGWGSRELGLATQSVIGLDLVLADGTEIHASETENADIYWAARGSGPGFFAVVLRYHLRLHPRFAFMGMKMQIFRMKHMEKVFRWAEEIGPDVSRQVEFQFVMTPKALGIFSPGIEIVAPILTHSRKEAKEAVRFLTDSPIRKHASLTTPLIKAPTWMMSTIATLTHFPSGMHWCADNMWTDAPIDDLLPGLKKVADTMPPAPSHALWLNWYPPGDRPDMAFANEAKHYFAVYGEWKKAVDDDKYINWATERISDMAEHSRGIQLADENLGRRPDRFTTDENLARLDTLRAKYDPEGIFNPWMGRITPPAKLAEAV